ncbi:MAG: hypothetical protein ABEN55_19275, partial [Bradymonadaceae bacterium]
VDWDTGINQRDTSSGVMYLLGTCGDLSTCKVNGGEYPDKAKKGALTYKNSTGSSETVYLYVARTTDFSPKKYDYQVDVNFK